MANKPEMKAQYYDKLMDLIRKSKEIDQLKIDLEELEKKIECQN